MRIRLLYLLCILSINPHQLNAIEKKIFVPYNNNIMILQGLQSSVFNSFQNHTFQYLIYDENIKDVEEYYKTALMQKGFHKDFIQKIQKDNRAYHFLKYSDNDSTFHIQLTRTNNNDIKIYICQMDNMILNDFISFSIENPQDNPGFDLHDVPRPKESIRFISILSSDNNQAIPSADGICNIIYKTVLSKKGLERFYLKQMVKYKWIPTYRNRFFHNAGGYWMIYNKENKSCLISILYLEEIKSNIIAVYYGYKNQ